ncbi:MAG: glycosyl hydrolase [Chitinophagaceae bacterium]|nr:glycosyl hydrolase [Chitinophagaceae bacterium]
MSVLLKKMGYNTRIFLPFVVILVNLHLATSVFAQVPPTPAAERLKVTEQRKALESKSVLNEIKFRNIGPTIMSGRVVDIDANPEDPTEFYVAYATGGLWHTTNNGQSFTPIMDNLDLLFIGDIAVNWTSAPRTIWVGTGEVNSSRSSYAGMGIYRSADNGKSWEYLGLPESHHIGKIQLHPTDNNIVWVAALGHLYSANKERGVYKTTDGGKTWKQTLLVDDNTGCVDLDINPSNPKEIYAAMWYRVRRAWKFEESGSSSGIYKSNDGGDTWKLVSPAGSGFMTGDKIGRIGITVYPKNPNIVYAVVDNNTPKPAVVKKNDSTYKKEEFKNITKEQFAQMSSKWLDTFLRANRFPRKYNAIVVKELVAADKIKPTALWDFLDSDDGFQNTGIAGCEVYRSDDAGLSWKKTNEKPIGIFNTYGYYFAKIYTSHYNPDKVFILGFYAEVSTDGGKTFNTMDKGNVHADHHALWVNPKRDSHVINGNDGGANITYDDGANWFKANTPPLGQYYAVTTDDAKPYNVYGGMQDNGSWWGPSNHKEDIGWIDNGQYAYKMINGGDGMQAQVDTRDNATVYSGSQFGVYGRYNKDRRGAQKSIRPQHELGDKPLRFNWQTPILLSKHNQDILYYGSNRLYRSLNKGDTMIAMSNDLTNGRVSGNVPYGTLTTISESPLRFGLIYTGTDDGNIHRSFDGGYSWEQLNQTTTAAPVKKGTKPPATNTKLNTNQLWVSRVTASQYKEAKVYTSLNGYRFDHFAPYLYVSEDHGNSWKPIGKDLPNEPINVVKEDPKDENILYVGTDGGLYVSFDAGNSFMLWNGGLPKSVPVHDIAIQQRDNELVLGTHGRSLYVTKLDDVHGIKKDPDWLKKKPKEKTQETRRPADNNESDPEM